MGTATQRRSDDPFARLEEQAHRVKAEEDAAKLVSMARIKLIVTKEKAEIAAYCFFATLALKLKLRMDWNIPTAATDGKHLDVNPDWFNALTLQEAKGVVAHEVMHNALAHPARRQGRDPARFNVACDLAINPCILASGLQLPGGPCIPGKGKFSHLPTGKSAEEYYGLLDPPPPKQQGDDGDGEGDGEGDGQGQQDAPDPGNCGAVRDPGDGSQAACQQCEAEWQVAAAQAHQVAKQRASQSRGTMPSWLDEMMGELMAPKVSWKDVLREFVSSHARNDYSWANPNRRFVHMGIYLPGLRSEELGELVVTLDESGSISDEQLREFGSELQGILDSFDVKLTILHHDTEVHVVEEWTPSDGPLVLRRKCNGGTSHRDVFDWIDKNVERPTCVLCLTDLYTAYPDQAPNYPVLWTVAPGYSSQEPPFGQVLEIK